MSISTKLQSIANNVPRVYDAGKSEAYEEIQDLNDELEQTLYGTDTGGKSFYDEFWDLALTSTNFTGRFAGSCWNEKTFKPNKSLVIYGNANMAFYVNGYNGSLTELAQSLGIEIIIKPSSLLQGFAYSKFTECKVDCSSLSDLYNTFYSASNLVTLELTGVSESLLFNGTFTSCSSLENVIINGVIAQNINIQWSTKLTRDSLMGIISILKDNSGTETWNSITLGPDNLAKLSQEELEIMDNKQWEYT